MSIEQKPGVTPDHPRTIKDVVNATGMSSATALGQINRDTNLAPFTDPEGHVWLSEKDWQLVVQAINEKNISSRTDLESAILPDGSQITAKKTLHIQQLTEIVTQARERQQTFSLEQIINALDPTPKTSNKSKTDARKKALNAIRKYRIKIQSNGWVIDLIIPREDKEKWKNPQFWFRHKNEPPFAPLSDTEALAKKEIILPNGERIKVKKNTLAMTAIRRAVLAQQNGTYYLGNEIATLAHSPFHNTHESRVNLVVSRANRILGKHGLRFAAYETEVDGKTVRAFRIMEEKTKPTASPEQKSPII